MVNLTDALTCCKIARPVMFYAHYARRVPDDLSLLP